MPFGPDLKSNNPRKDPRLPLDCDAVQLAAIRTPITGFPRLSTTRAENSTAKSRGSMPKSTIKDFTRRVAVTGFGIVPFSYTKVESSPNHTAIDVLRRGHGNRTAWQRVGPSSFRHCANRTRRTTPGYHLLPDRGGNPSVLS